MAPNEGVQAWRASIGAMLCLIVGPSVLIVGTFGVFSAPLQRAYGWSPGQIGFAVPLVALAIMLVSPIQGMLIDRFGARRVIMCSVPAFSLGFALLAFLPVNLFLFYLAWFIMPLLGVGLWPAAYLKSVAQWFDRRLGLAIGLSNAGIGVGTIILPPLAALLIDRAGVSHAYAGLALLALLALPLAMLMLPERVRPVLLSESLVEGESEAPTIKDVCADRNFRAIARGFFLLGITGTGIVTNLVPILVATGMNQMTAVMTMSVYGAAALVGRLVTGALLDQLHAKWVMGAFIAGAIGALLALAATPPAFVAIAAAILLGLIMGAEFDALAYMLPRYFDFRLFGRLYGLIFGLFQLGAVLGAALLAATVTLTRGYELALLLFSGTLLVSMMMFSRLGQYGRVIVNH